MFPDLVGVKSPGTSVGGYIKALLPEERRGGAAVPKAYAGFAASSLPEGANAAGIRAGAANSLHASMPISFACTTTGHTMTGLTSLFEYVDAVAANAMPGAVELAGYPALPWAGSTNTYCLPRHTAALTHPASITHIPALTSTLTQLLSPPACDAVARWLCANACLTLWLRD